MALLDYRNLVDDLVRDEAGKIGTTVRDRAIAIAVARYSADRPRILVEDVVSDGSNFLPLPVAWIDGESSIQALEYPVGEWPPSHVSPEWYGVVRGPTGDEIRLAGAILYGDVIRVTMGLPHSLTIQSDTLPATVREPVACYAASILMDQLASLHAADGDSTISADTVDHRSQSAEYAARARTLRGRYYDGLGIDPKRVAPACVVVDVDLLDSRGQDRLTHPRRHR